MVSGWRTLSGHSFSDLPECARNAVEIYVDLRTVIGLGGGDRLKP